MRLGLATMPDPRHMSLVTTPNSRHMGLATMPDLCVWVARLAPGFDISASGSDEHTKTTHLGLMTIPDPIT